MKGGKLFKLLATLSQAEFKALKKVVASPIYNTNERMMVLYNALKRQYPKFNSTQKGKKSSLRKVFPDEPFNNYKIHRLFTQMTQLLEEYLLLLDQRNNDTERKKRLIQIYTQRNSKAFFDNETGQLSEELANSPYQDLEYYEAQSF